MRKLAVAILVLVSSGMGKNVAAATPLPADQPRTVEEVIDRVVVNDATQREYLAQVVVSNNGDVKVIKARPGDAIALALENNLDIAIARYNLNIADTDVQRAKAGAQILGVNLGVVQNTPGGGVGGIGAEIARHAWPARLARDGTLHVHARDSIWAFELTARADEIRARLGAVAPRRIAFSPGPLPESVEDKLEPARRRPPKPTAEHLAKAESLVRVIRDEDLRKVVANAIAASFSSADNDRSFC